MGWPKGSWQLKAAKSQRISGSWALPCLFREIWNPNQFDFWNKRCSRDVHWLKGPQSISTLASPLARDPNLEFGELCQKNWWKNSQKRGGFAGQRNPLCFCFSYQFKALFLPLSELFWPSSGRDGKILAQSLLLFFCAENSIPNHLPCLHKLGSCWPLNKEKKNHNTGILVYFGILGASRSTKLWNPDLLSCWGGLQRRQQH